MARPRKYADDAEKMRAFRAAKPEKCFRPGAQVAATIEKIAREQGRTENEVITNLVKFALLNRNWLTLGLITYRDKD